MLGESHYHYMQERHQCMAKTMPILVVALTAQYAISSPEILQTTAYGEGITASIMHTVTGIGKVRDGAQSI